VEHRLEQMEGVSDSAVVVVGDGEQGRELVGFYSGPAALSVPSLRAFLGGSLPEYMIPSRFRWLPALPLTHNGKTDRKRLAHLAAELGPAEPARRAPETPTERWLAGAWAELLGVPAAQVGRDDDFFEHGGTSLSAVRLVIKLDRRVTLEDLAAHGRLVDLARLVDDRAATAGLE
jgi:hypothetical protein